MTEDQQKAACRSMGTGQCAAICLSHSSNFTRNGECPEAKQVWTAKAIRKERQRRPKGPLEEVR